MTNALYLFARISIFVIGIFSANGRTQLMRVSITPEIGLATKAGCDGTVMSRESQKNEKQLFFGGVGGGVTTVIG